MTVEMISRRLALFISSIALLGTLAFSVPAARFFTSSPPEKKTLRVMTYNIHVGVGMDKKLDLQRIAEVINAEHPDRCENEGTGTQLPCRQARETDRLHLYPPL
jgi:hypothetical protein